MSWVKIRNLSRPLPESLWARYCRSFSCRLRGLTFQRALAPDRGLLLVQGRQDRLNAAIHMLFVWVDLAVVWADSEKVVVDTRLARRWRPLYLPGSPARYVLEAAPAWLAAFEIGDQLDFEETSLD
jgi:uncharacterized membrane protein (UPF0127 family)